MNTNTHASVPATNLPSAIEINGNVSRILHYISTHFQNSLLSLKIASEDLGMSEREISSLLESSLNTTFKEYLMKIRLQEMRRLLMQTSYPMKEIYKNIGLPDPLARR